MLNEVLVLLIILAAGSLGSMLGVGGGFIIVPALVLLLNFSMHEAVSISLASISGIALSSFLTYAWNKKVDYRLGILLELFTFLEGPFESNEMSANLNSDNYLPLNQPYSMSPWNYNGTESVLNIPNNDVVDWVLIELRDAPDVSSANITLQRKAAFLLKNGSVVDIDGSSLLHFGGSVYYNLFVVIWHRNHLAILSSNPLNKSNGVFSYNFTSSPTMAFGGPNVQKELAPGIWGLIASDGNADGQIDNKDKNDVWILQQGVSGYNQGDYNMDGNVESSDKTDWNTNSGKASQIPH